MILYPATQDENYMFSVWSTQREFTATHRTIKILKLLYKNNSRFQSEYLTIGL